VPTRVHPVKDSQINRARLLDAPAIHRLILYGTRRGKVLKRPLAEIQERIHSFFVYRVEGKVVGCVSLDIYNKKLAEIRSLVVASPWENREFASQLVRRCVREARKHGVYEVLAITDRDRLFRRYGFQEELHGQKALFHRPQKSLLK
jgi:N-acetylglutamate synthase-like GNAT family acetyltransferase